MSLLDVGLWVLIAIPFIDFPAAWILVRAARETPRIPLLHDRARAAVLGTLAAALAAILSLLFVNGIELHQPWGTLLLFGALLLPGLIAPLFLADYLLGHYDQEA